MKDTEIQNIILTVRHYLSETIDLALPPRPTPGYGLGTAL